MQPGAREESVQESMIELGKKVWKKSKKETCK